MTYVLLIYSGVPPGETLPEADEATVLARHRALQADAGAAGQLHAVARLTDVGQARTVRHGANGIEVLDGPYAESKEWLVGFYLIDCEDDSQALRRAGQICPTGHHSVEVRPAQWHHAP